jgi:hypothetical protein
MGNPSSINMARDTNKKIGENSIIRSNASIRLNKLIYFKVF